MLALKSITGLTRLFRRPTYNSSSAVLGCEEFQRLIQRERLRVDRNSETFSLIVMAPRSRKHADKMFPELIRVLHSRLRATDDVGQIEGDRLGILLPDTPSAGAWTVVDHVVHLLPKDVLSPICEVYTYPSFGDGESELDSCSDDGEPGGIPIGSEENAGFVGDEAREVRRMESLFMISLPPWKRGLDILGASLGLILLSPLLACVAIAVKLTSPGPVFFRQLRRGQGGKAFALYKFRSMVDGAESLQQDLRHRNEQDGPAFKIKADPRITPLGKLLRRTGLDEFPQFWNVLKGDMTLVGPRPLPCHESDESETWQQRRLDAKPGLTCIWQSRGHKKVSFADWMRMDMQYLEKQNFSVDATLAAKTALMVLRCKASG
jgi:lipopolysaccharide/colanic/teichoic acid biosynthesis glycosyltransferase